MLFGKHVNKYYLKYCYLFLIGILADVFVDIIQTLLPEYLGIIVDNINNLDTSFSWDLIPAAFSNILTSIGNTFTFSTTAIEGHVSLPQLIIEVMIITITIVVLRMLWRLCLFRASHSIEASLRKEMFAKAERLSVSYYQDNNVGTVLNWFTDDIETITDCMGWGLIMIIDALVLSAVALMRMFGVNIALAIIALLPVLLIVVWGWLMESYQHNRWMDKQYAYDKVYDFANENFTGIRVIKAFVKEYKEIHAFAKVAKESRDKSYKFSRTSVLTDTVISAIAYIDLALVIGLGAWFVYLAATSTPATVFGISVDITMGDLTKLIGYIEIIVWPMVALGQVLTMTARARGSLKRISLFLDAEEDIKNPENAVVLENVKGEITFNNFSFSYPKSERENLSNITLTIKPGETVGIVGKIGSGKTTLVNSLLRLYNVGEGQILIDGVDIMQADITSLRNAIAYAPQDNFLFSDKISNNVSFSSPEVDMDEVRAATDFAAITEDIDGFVNGFDTVSGERGVTLSGGQKQRTSLARAFYKHAPILIMDDTVSAVDVKTEETILKNVKEQRSGQTTLVIASRVSTVNQMDKIIVLDDGKLSGFGTPEELSKNNPIYQRMVYLQQLESEMEGGNA